MGVAQGSGCFVVGRLRCRVRVVLGPEVGPMASERRARTVLRIPGPRPTDWDPCAVKDAVHCVYVLGSCRGAGQTGLWSF